MVADDLGTVAGGSRTVADNRSTVPQLRLYSGSRGTVAADGNTTVADAYIYSIHQSGTVLLADGDKAIADNMDTVADGNTAVAVDMGAVADGNIVVADGSVVVGSRGTDINRLVW